MNNSLSITKNRYGWMMAMVIVVSLFTQNVYGQKLKKYKFNNGTIAILLPKELAPMTVEDMAYRYPSVRKPIASYTNETREVDFSINISATQWINEDLEIAQSFFKSSIINLYDRVNFYQEGIEEISGKKFIVFEFDSYVRGTEGIEAIRKYTYVVYYIHNSKTIVFSFHTPFKEKEAWNYIADQVMKSIKIKKL